MNKEQNAESNGNFFVVIKNKKYLSSYGYFLGKRKYRWTNDVGKAMKFDPMHSDADHFASATKGKIISKI